MAITTAQARFLALYMSTNLTQREMAKQVGVAEQTVSKWLKQDDFLDALQKEQRRYFSTAATAAAKKLVELIDCNNTGVALGACRDILDRAGLKPTDKVDINGGANIIVNIDGIDGDKK